MQRFLSSISIASKEDLSSTTSLFAPTHCLPPTTDPTMATLIKALEGKNDFMVEIQEFKGEPNLDALIQMDNEGWSEFLITSILMHDRKLMLLFLGRWLMFLFIGQI